MDGLQENKLDALCACAELRRAARAATQLYDLVLQPVGLKATQFFALRSIDEAGEIAQWKFARDHTVAVETLSRRFAALRKKGLITMRTGANHGERLYALTEKGKEFLNQAMPYWERAQQRLRQSLGDFDFQNLLRLCESTVAAAHNAEQMRATNCVPMHAQRNSPGDHAGAAAGKDSIAS
jgi:DNA-binding MarR family transcriptional regulator